MFSANTYQQRRQRLMETVGSGLILILGNSESSMNYTDNVYPFRQDSNFLYFFGLDRPDLAAVLNCETQEVTVFGDDLPLEYIVWMGPQQSLAEAAERVGVTATRPYADLATLFTGSAPIHYLPPYRATNTIKLHQWLGLEIGAVQTGASEVLIKAIVEQASIKSSEEIAEMEKAVNISRSMHMEAMKMAKSGKVETELAGLVEGIAKACGGRLAYSVILTINGQTLHNHHHHNVLQDGRLILGDFGAETNMHYASDITRTFPVANRFNDQQKEIYEIVLKAETEAIAACKPGVKYLDIHLQASKTIATGLSALGLMKGDVEEAVAAGAHALFFPHGLGHMIGLDVHDMEDLGEDLVGYGDEVKRSTQFGLKSLRLARTLQSGFALTVEPGIYFIPELIDQWKAEGKFTEFINYEALDAYRNFGGIRIEDDIVVTEDGSRLIGMPIPKTVAEVEALRAGN